MPNNSLEQGLSTEEVIKPKKRPLIIILNIVGIILLLMGSALIISLIEENTKKVWESGQVTILDKKIQLPCSVSDFEKKAGAKIFDNGLGEAEIKKAIISTASKELLFDVYIEKEMVTGIILNAYSSDEDPENFVNPGIEYARSSERDIAAKVYFPGHFNIESDIKAIKKAYRSLPFNLAYTYSKETLNDGTLMECYSYQSKEWMIYIDTKDGEIVEIQCGRK